ncbi:GntR family transcriptional regulator [Roseibium sp. SCP14]|uniref:GntR family transcriptional regulator n=1 Tax=Roseibium sp. SCP14 TaxID=3141375 RepID=UPI00333D9174
MDEIAQNDSTLAGMRKPSVDFIQETILERICFLEYVPGDQLKEAVIAREFGVSRTPVRDALSRISHLGLVETRNGVGTVVVKMSDEKIRHLYETRQELASLIGQLSPMQIDDSHRAEARKLHEQAIELRAQFEPQEFVRLNQKMQALISSLIGNQVLRDFWNQTYLQAASLWHRMADTFGDQVSDALVRETADLITALDKNDIAAVGFLQRIHIGYGYQLIRENLLGKDGEE